MPVDYRPDGTPVHMPKDKDRFEFDGEVATVFDNMAARSIPLFFETHRQHARLAKAWLSKPQCSLLDIGASRGAFLREVAKVQPLHEINAFATDNSPAMVNHLAADFPDVEVSQVDITSHAFLSCPRTYDVINITYVLQFIPKDLQRMVLARVCAMVKPGGVLFIGHKRASECIADSLAENEYIQWRMDNGYTPEEIEAKTAALKNSMWPMSEAIMIECLRNCGMADVVRTSSWTVFSNFMCIKR